MATDKQQEDAFKLSLYLSEFEDDYDLLAEQREQASEDMRFCAVPGGQWEGWMEDVYKERTKLELDMINLAVERFMGDFADNRIDVKFSPNGGNTSEGDSKIMQGIYRRDSRRGRGRESILSSVGESVRCGFGAIKLSTVYEDEESGDDESQRVIFEHIPSAYLCVAFDSNAKLSDKSDAKHVTVIHEYQTDAFEREFPGFALSSVAVDDSNRRFSWHGKDSIYVAQRYEVKERKTRIHVFIDPKTESIEYIEQEDLELVEADLLRRGWEKIRTKKLTKREVFKSVFTGSQFIEKDVKISGKYLPVIPFYAYRLYVDGEEFFWGLVRKQKDSQRLFNMEVSQAAEVSSTGNRDIPIIDPRTISGYERYWTSGNIYDKQFLPGSRIVDSQGNMIDPLQGVIPSAKMSPTSAVLLETVSQYIKETTGGQQADITDTDLSGKAIRELTKRANLNTRSIWTSIESSISQIGRVYKSIADDIYSIQRVIHMLDEDGSESSINLMQAVMDDRGSIDYTNNIKKMKFDAYASIGSAYESQRNETVDTLRSLISESKETQFGAEYHPVLFASLFENISGTGLEPLKEFNRKKMLQLGLVDPRDEREAKYIESLAQPSSQDELVEAAAQQQMAEADDLRANAIERLSKTELNRAKAVEAIEKIKTDRIKALREAISTAA